MCGLHLCYQLGEDQLLPMYDDRKDRFNKCELPKL